MNVGQTGSARFTCVAQFCLLSLGGRVLSLQHCESCLDKTELDSAGSKDRSGCLNLACSCLTLQRFCLQAVRERLRLTAALCFSLPTIACRLTL